MENNQFFKQISLWSILSAAVLSVLLVVPITDNFVDNSKSYLLFFSSILVVLLFVLKTLKEKAVRFTISPITSSLVLFGLAALASTFFTANYPVESLLGMGGVYIATSLIAILGGSLIPKDSVSKFINTLSVAGVLLVVLNVLQLVGFGPAQLISRVVGVTIPTTSLFNIAGSPFVALQVVGIAMVGVFATIAKSKKISKLHAVSLPVLAIGAVMFLWALLPGKDTSLVLPPLNTSWSIMLDTIRNPRSALIGIGPSAYTNAYSAYKPLWMNGTERWNVVFSQAANFPLTLLTTMGVLGLTAWGFFVTKFFKLHKKALESTKPLSFMVGVIIVLQIVMPVNTIILTIQAIALAVLIANEKHRLPLLQMQALKFKVLNKEDFAKRPSKALSLPLYLSVGVGLIGVTAMFYLVGRAYAANVVMAQSSKAMANNDLVAAYEHQQKAVALNPYVDTFRRRYSSTNAIIAIALSNKADITDIEREQVSSLLQQSVREARAATTLDPIDTNNWVNLARIYQNMIGVSEDAAQWTVQSYISAIQLDPNNPTLRIDLANVFVSQESYQQAVSILSQAIELKSDLAGTHYTMALVLEQVGTPDAYRQARVSLQRALVLLDSDSEDYIVVNKKIEDLEAMMEEQGISLTAETETQEGQSDQAMEETTMMEETSPEIETPTITEQNLNAGGDVGDAMDSGDVDLTPPADDQNIPDQGSDTKTTNLTDEL